MGVPPLTVNTQRLNSLRNRLACAARTRQTGVARQIRVRLLGFSPILAAAPLSAVFGRVPRSSFSKVEADATICSEAKAVKAFTSKHMQYTRRNSCPC